MVYTDLNVFRHLPLNLYTLFNRGHLLTITANRGPIVPFCYKSAVYTINMRTHPSSRYGDCRVPHCPFYCPFSKEFPCGRGVGIVPIEIPLRGLLSCCCKDPTTYHKHVHNEYTITLSLIRKPLSDNDTLYLHDTKTVA